MKMNLMACFVGEASRLPTGAARTPHLRWLLLAILALPALANTPPEITNVRASQRTDTKLVDIYYDAADADGDLLKVRIEISDNDGLKYSVPAFSLTGDIGEGIAAGKDKHIVWDAGTDWDGEYSDKMRVKVYAIDAQGFPGLEWGNEVPPGGFLMGQDGGAEGSGPSKHINIPWSYWLSKYEITCQQYCDFLNAAVVAGQVEVRDMSTTVYSCDDAQVMPNVVGALRLLVIGDAYDIRWNVNNFEVCGNRTNYPVRVTFYGAAMFAKFYGYDLPTEAEWEKAARGPDHDDQDEHLIYSWGDEISESCANWCQYPGRGFIKEVGYYDGNQTPIGEDMINGYGLYDVVGNLAEWTRSFAINDICAYPSTEVLSDALCGYGASKGRVVRGGSYLSAYNGYEMVEALRLYYRASVGENELNTCSYSNREDLYNIGFRVVRRVGVPE